MLNITINSNTRRLHENNSNKSSKSSLTESESSIFQFLSNSYPAEVSRERLLEIGWPDRVVTENSATVALSHIRSILQNELDSTLSILAVRNKGYVLSEAVNIDISNNGTQPSEQDRKPFASDVNVETKTSHTKITFHIIDDIITILSIALALLFYHHLGILF